MRERGEVGGGGRKGVSEQACEHTFIRHASVGFSFITCIPACNASSLSGRRTGVTGHVGQCQ